MFQEIVIAITTLTGVAISLSSLLKKKQPTCAYEEIEITEYDPEYIDIWADDDYCEFSR